jgi:glyoxylate reductase
MEKPMRKIDARVFATGTLADELSDRIVDIAELEVWYEPSIVPEDLLIEKLQNCCAVVCVRGDKINAKVMDACPELKLVANVAVGYDNVDMAEANKRGILVTNTPGVLDNATADLAFGLLLACARRIAEGDRYVREGHWQGFKEDLLLGTEISGKTLGIVGMGRIGEAMARRGRGFGMQILYTRKGDEEKDKRLTKEHSAQRVSLGEILKRSDFVSIHCPLNQSTKHLIGRAELAQMKRRSILINTARGAVINEKELVLALQEGKVAGAGLDVFEFEPEVSQELLALPNVVLAPHIGSATHETRLAMKTLAVENLLSALEGIVPRNAVNKDTWPAFIKRMSEVIVADEEESSDAQPAMPWS